MAAGVTIQLKRHKTGDLDMTTVLADGEFLLDTVHSRLYIGDGSSTLEELALNGMTLYLDEKAQEPQPMRPTGLNETYKIAGTYLDRDETYQVSGRATAVEKPCTLSGSLGNQNTPVYISNGRFATCNTMPIVPVRITNEEYPYYNVIGVTAGSSNVATAYISHRVESDGFDEHDIGGCSMRNGMFYSAPSLTRADTRPNPQYLMPYAVAPVLTSYTKGFDYEKWNNSTSQWENQSNTDLFNILKDISDRLKAIETEVGI